MTFSIVARCPDTGRFGVAITTSSPAVGARCPYARAGVGAVATQNRTDPRLGPAILDRLAAGASARQALDAAIAAAPFAHWRQVAVVDAAGGVASHHGTRTLALGAEARGPGVVALGNLLASVEVPPAMLAAFGETEGPFEQRLLAALAAGEAAGGEVRPLRSAALLVVDRDSFPLTDLRIDHDEAPLRRLEALWALWAPEAGAYLRRVHDPDRV